MNFCHGHLEKTEHTVHNVKCGRERVYPLCKFHVLIEIEIIYTAQHMDAKKPDKPDKNIGTRKAYPVPSSTAGSSTCAWNIVSSTIGQMYGTSEVKKVKYTDAGNNDVYLVNREEMEKAIFREGIGMFHVLFQYEPEVHR